MDGTGTSGHYPASKSGAARRASIDPTRLAAILEHGSELVIVTDMDANLLYSSGAGRDLLGYEPADLLGSNVLTLLHPDDLAEAAAALNSTSSSHGVKEPFEVRVAHADGTWVRFETIATNLLADPEVAGLVFHCRSLTDRDEIANRYRILHEFAPFAIALVTDDYAQVHANRTFAELFKTTMSNLATTSLTTLFKSDSANEALAAIRSHIADPHHTPHVDITARRIDGSTFIARVHGHRLKASASVSTNAPGFILGIEDVSAEISAANALSTSEAKFSALVNHSADIIAVLYPDGDWEASDAGTRHLGYPKGFDPEGGVFSLVHPEDLEIAASGLSAVLDGTRGPDAPIELRLRSADGTYWDFECVGQNLGDLGAIGGVVITARNITQRKRTEAALREAQERFRAAFEHAPLCLALLDIDGSIRDLNPSGCAMLGYSLDELVSRPIDHFVLADDRRLFTDGLREILNGDKARQIEHRLVNRQDNVLWALTDAALITDASGAPSQIILMLADVTQRKRSEELLSYGATHDALTSLLNRSAFADRLDHALSRRTDVGSTALLFLDLDRFKAVNDTLGHQAGDAVLIEISQRLRRASREADTVARLGGDEFVVLCEDLNDPAEAIEIAERIALLVESPIAVGSRTATVGASIGIAISDGAQSADALMRNADAAVYRAKHEGRSRIEIFDAALRAAHSHRRALEIGLRQAIEHHTLAISYLPIVGLINREVRGYQSHCAWDRPDGSCLEHTSLAETASEMGLAAILDRLMLSSGCIQAARWRGDSDTNAPLLHVGLSPRHLDDTSLIKGVQSALIGTSLPPRQVCIEVAESWVLRDPQHALATLQRLREIGVQLALADFGKSSTSVAILRKIDVDFVKLAHSFYAEVAIDAPGQAIVAAVIALAHSVGFAIIADGVATVDDVRALIQLDCDYAQGPYFSSVKTRAA